MQFLTVLVLSGLWLVLSPLARAQTASFSVLHQFNAAVDGTGPGTLAQGANGDLYGTTAGDGTTHFGTVFRMTPTGTVTTLYTFSGPDGQGPAAGVLLTRDGNLYGTTSLGGSTGNGTIFRLDPAGALTTLHTFSDTEGRHPRAGLIQGKDGNFYGTTPGGGGQVYGGTVYQMTPAGVFTTLHTFAYHDNSSPEASLIVGTDGNFYGTSFGDGPARSGTVFSITPGGVFTVLYSFSSTYSGFNPHGALVQGVNGDFYGTTTTGGYSNDGYGGQGTIFDLTPGGSLSTLYTFDTEDGGSSFQPSNPTGALVQTPDGVLFGATFFGGSNGTGQIFSISPAGVFTRLHHFGAIGTTFINSDGAYPSGNMITGSDGNIYGSAGTGGTNGNGTIFKITLSAAHAAFFAGEGSVGSGVYYLQLPSGNPFGYYSYLADPKYIFHFDLGYEYVSDANDGKNGVYLYDFASNTFFYTSPGFPFPYLYDFSLNSTVYYYPDPDNPGRYNTNGVRYFYVFDTGKIISK